MPRFSVLISGVALILLLGTASAKAQALYPQNAGERVRSTAMIEMSKGYVSGICVMYNDGEDVKASIFNEFGISAIDFVYYPKKDKVKLLNVIKMLDKWYIRKLLKSDLRKVVHCLQQGIGEYRNEKYKIDYKFSKLQDDTEE